MDVVMLVGHGGPAKDTPRPLVRKLKMLESQRRPGTPMSPEEAELDAEVRGWPRSPDNDPYKYGLERLAEVLRPRVAPAELRVAYNEFCAPSIDDAVAATVAEGARRITFVTTMFTPGGSHAEEEIPAIIDALRPQFPDVEMVYAWPFDLERCADLLAGAVAATQ